MKNISNEKYAEIVNHSIARGNFTNALEIMEIGEQSKVLKPDRRTAHAMSFLRQP